MFPLLSLLDQNDIFTGKHYICNFLCLIFYICNVLILIIVNSCYRTHAESKGIIPLSWPVFLAGLNESRDALLKKLSAEQAAMIHSSSSQQQGIHI